MTDGDVEIPGLVDNTDVAFRKWVPCTRHPTPCPFTCALAPHTHNTMDEYDEAVLFTYALLESRLARLEYLLSGPPATGGAKPQTIPDRIHRIEASLQQLAGKTALLDNVEKLCKNKFLYAGMEQELIAAVKHHKDVLTPQPDPEHDTVPLSPSQKSALVIDRAPSFATTASQLKALSDAKLPPTDGFVKLAKLRPRIAEAEAVHLQQALKISELRRRSGLLVQRDKQVLWVAAGSCWKGQQERLVRSYRALQREEARRRVEVEGE